MLAATTFCLLGITGCGRHGGQAAKPRPGLVAADGVLCDLTTRLAGSAAAVECLLGPGDDPHNYQLKPAQRRALSQADLVLVNGYGLTPAVEKGHGQFAVAELAVPGSPLLGSPPGSGPGGNRDPHVWHDPSQAQAMVGWLAQKLIATAPQASSRIAAKAARMDLLLSRLDGWNRRQLATIPPTRSGRLPPIATGHRAYASYARAYGLAELPVIHASSSSETLRPNDFQAVVAQLHARAVPHLFIEPGPVPRDIQRISELSGVPLASEPLVLDGLAKGKRGSLSLMETLVQNTCVLVNGLGGRCDRRSGEDLVRAWAAVN